jgi:hypothetical protein
MKWDQACLHLAFLEDEQFIVEAGIHLWNEKQKK